MKFVTINTKPEALFLHGLESNPGSSLQTEEEAGLPWGRSGGSKRPASRRIRNDFVTEQQQQRVELKYFYQKAKLNVWSDEFVN